VTTLAQLTAIAYRREMVASRRLAIRHHLAIEVALQRILQESAGNGSLDELIAARQRATAEQQARRAARKKRQADRRADKKQCKEHFTEQLKSSAPDRWQAWFDGACHPNPGKMSIGVSLRSPLGASTEISQTVGWGDSSEAEYRALIALLQAATSAQVRNMVIYGDSRVVLDDVQGSDLQGSKILRPLRVQAQQLMAGIPDLAMRWIPRARNTVADALSQTAIARVAASLPVNSTAVESTDMHAAEPISIASRKRVEGSLRQK
jgi:ribonuclease HI